MNRIKFTFLVLFLNITTLLFSQNGTLTGIVFEESTNSPLPYAQIALIGTNNGTICDLDGKYSIRLPVGDNRLVFQYIGYRDFETTITIEEGETHELNVYLETTDMLLEEAVITAQLVGQLKAINQQVNSDALVNVVSGDKMKELPDVNAAEAIGRLPGVALERNAGEGSKVIIRGLSPKYNSITINGVKLPSDNGTNRSVDLSMISSELLSGIEVYKQPLPNLDAESIGGTVNLNIRKASDKPQTIIKVSDMYNHIRKDFGNYRALAQINRRFFDNKIGVILQANSESINRSSDIYQAGWTLQTIADPNDPERTLLHPTVPLTHENRNSRLTFTNLRRVRTGGSINLDYDYGVGNVAIYSFFSQSNNNSYAQQKSVGVSTNRYNYSINESMRNTWSNALNGNFDLRFVNIDYAIAYAMTKSNVPYQYSISLRDGRSESEGPLTLLIPKEAKFEPWNYFANLNEYPETATLESDRETFSYVFEDNKEAKLDFDFPISLSSNISGNIKLGGAFKSVTRERDSYHKTHHYAISGASNLLVEYEKMHGEQLVSNSGNRVLASNFYDVENPEKQYVNTEKYGNIPVYPVLDPDKIRKLHKAAVNDFGWYYRVSASSMQNNYWLTEQKASFYAMAPIQIGKMFRIIPGLRFEKWDDEYHGKIKDGGAAQYSFEDQDQSTDLDEIGALKSSSSVKTGNYFFPHLHTKFAPVNWFDFRASVSKTITRPDYYSLIPRYLINALESTISAGNPYIEPMISTNFDITATFYESKFGMLRAGYFYKNLSNPYISKRQLVDSADLKRFPAFETNILGYLLSSYINTKDAKVSGFEAEWQTNTSFLPAPFNSIVFSINYTYLSSEFEYMDTEIYNITPVPIYIPGVGYMYPDPIKAYRDTAYFTPLPDMVKHTLNVSLGYDYKGFSGRVSINYQGDRVVRYSSGGFGEYDNNFGNSSFRVDASVKQKISKYTEVFLNLSNVTNESDEMYKYQYSYLNTSKLYGMTGELGVLLKF